MTWAKLSDNFHSHPKVQQLGLPAVGLYAMGLSYAAHYLTDGFLPESWVRSQVKGQPYRGLIQRLVAAKAWETVLEPPGYRIVDFLDYNPSAEELRQKRHAANARQTRYRERNNALVTQTIGPDPTHIGPEALLKDAFALDVDREIEEYVAQLADATDATPYTVREYRKKLPEAAFRAALESLAARRKRKPKLDSETRYFIASLQTMLREGAYR